MVTPLHLFYVSFSTMFKLVAAVVVGIFASPHLNTPETSEKGLSFIALRILLPSMLFGNLVLDISLELLRKYYWAVIMSLIPQLLGVFFSLILCRLVTKQWRVLMVLGSTFQNGLVYPLSVVTNIKGVDWFTEEAMRRSQQYVFLYNLTCALGLWSIGSPLIKFFKDKEVAAKEEMEEDAVYASKMQRRRELLLLGASIAPLPPQGDGVPPASKEEKKQAVNCINQLAAEIGPLADLTLDENDEQRSVSNDTVIPPSFRASSPSESLSSSLSASSSYNVEVEEVPAPHREELPEDEAADEVAAVPTPPTEGPASPAGANASATSSLEVASMNAASRIELMRASSTLVAPTPPPSYTKHKKSKYYVEENPDLTTHLSAATLQKEWYRPAKRHERPIDVRKFDAFFALAGAAGKQPSADVPEAEDDEEEGALAPPGTRAPKVAAAKRPPAPSAALPIPAKPATIQLAPGEAVLSPQTPESGLRFYKPPSAAAKPIKVSTFNEEQAQKKKAEEMKRKELERQERLKRKEERKKAREDKKRLKKQRKSYQAHDTDELRRREDDLTRALMNAPGAGGVVTSTEAMVAALNQAAMDTEWSTLGPGTGRGMADRQGIDIHLHNSERPWSYQLQRYGHMVYEALCMPPAYISIVAIAISLIPPLRWCAETVPGLTFINGIALVGTGCVPVQLVTLGCTLASKRTAAPTAAAAAAKPAPTDTPAATPSPQAQQQQKAKQKEAKGTTEKKDGPNEAAATTDAANRRVTVSDDILHASPAFNFSMEAVKEDRDDEAEDAAAKAKFRNTKISLFSPSSLWIAWDSVSSYTRFAAITILLRLLIIPAISFLIVHAMLRAKVMPTDQPFVVAILIGISSPAAVNSSLVCTMHGYHATPYARMIFAMYCLAAITSTFWLMVSIYYAGKLGTHMQIVTGQ